MAKNILTDNFSEPLKEAAAAKVDIHAGDGNLTIDRLSDNEQVLASGTLQYFEKQGLPTRTLVSSNDQAILTIRGGSDGQHWFHLPWSACNGATEWQIHLNPSVPSNITAHSDGGNVKLDLAGMTIIKVAADTGGGNVDLILPDNAENINASAQTGAGNVTVEIGSGIKGSNAVYAKSGAGIVIVNIPKEVATRIHATTGLGKLIMDPRLEQLDKATYQSPDYETASVKVEITASSGAGNVSVNFL